METIHKLLEWKEKDDLFPVVDRRRAFFSKSKNSLANYGFEIDEIDSLNEPNPLIPNRIHLDSPDVINIILQANHKSLDADIERAREIINFCYKAKAESFWSPCCLSCPTQTERLNTLLKHIVLDYSSVENIKRPKVNMIPPNGCQKFSNQDKKLIYSNLDTSLKFINEVSTLAYGTIIETTYQICPYM